MCSMHVTVKPELPQAVVAPPQAVAPPNAAVAPLKAAVQNPQAVPPEAKGIFTVCVCICVYVYALDLLQAQ